MLLQGTALRRTGALRRCDVLGKGERRLAADRGPALRCVPRVLGGTEAVLLVTDLLQEVSKSRGLREELQHLVTTQRQLPRDFSSTWTFLPCAGPIGDT